MKSKLADILPNAIENDRSMRNLPFVLVIIFDFYVYHALDSSSLPDRVNMSNMGTCVFEAESEFQTQVRNPLSDTSPSTETFN